MELFRLPADEALRPDPVARGWARAVYRGPSTVGEVLERASRAMDEADEAAAYASDPIGYVTAQNRRRTLLGRLLTGGKPWR
jgi:hypothetical protein